MKRNIAAVIAAVLVGGVVVFAIDALGHSFYKVSPDIDLSSREAISEYIKALPLGALLFVAFAQATGAFCGGFVSGIISKRSASALIYGGIALLMGVCNLVEVPHPIWLSVLLVMLPVPSALLGSLSAISLVGKTSGGRPIDVV